MISDFPITEGKSFNRADEAVEYIAYLYENNCEKIENINIYQIPLNNNGIIYPDESGGSIVMEINLENNRKFHFGMYNEHDGYNSHDVWLNVYKNEDIEPTRVVFREL